MLYRRAVVVPVGSMHLFGPPPFDERATAHFPRFCDEFGVPVRNRRVLRNSFKAMAAAFSSQQPLENLAQVLIQGGFDTHSATYRAFTKASPTLSATQMDGMHRMALGSPLLSGHHVEVEVEQVKLSSGYSHVFRACLGHGHTALPVHLAHTQAADQRVGPMVNHAMDTLAAIGRPLEFRSRHEISVDHLLASSRVLTANWTGRVSPLWAPPASRAVQWHQPESADLISVGDALARADDKFAFVTIDGSQLLIHGPTPRGRYYIHAHGLAAASGEPHVEAAKVALLRDARELDQDAFSMDLFAVERLRLLDRSEKQYFIFTRVILLACFFGVWLDAASKDVTGITEAADLTREHMDGHA